MLLPTMGTRLTGQVITTRINYLLLVITTQQVLSWLMVKSSRQQRRLEQIQQTLRSMLYRTIGILNQPVLRSQLLEV